MDIEDIAYELYKQDWVNTHVTPKEQMQTVQEWAEQAAYDIGEFEPEPFQDWLWENGYGGAIYVCMDEFLGAEYRDRDYMKNLLKNEVLITMYEADLKAQEEDIER